MMRLLSMAAVAALYPAIAVADERDTVADAMAADSRDCLHQSQMAPYLHQAWGETPVARGSLDNGEATVLYVSRRGSWTLVAQRTDGKACVEASGADLMFDGVTGARFDGAS